MIARRALFTVAGTVATFCFGAAPVFAERRLVFDGAVGPSYLTTSRSHAIGHGFKPMARLGLRLGLTRGIEVGGTVSGIMDASEHYRVLGGLAHGRWSLWQRPAFSFGAALAIGAGYDADILHADLQGKGGIRPYGFVAMDGRWSVRERWLVGVETAWENLSIFRLGLLLGFVWDASLPDSRSPAR